MGDWVSVYIIICESAIGRPTSEGHVIRHLCGVKNCCAPDHLSMGSKSENATDAICLGDQVTKLSAQDVAQVCSNTSLDDWISIAAAAAR